jgi:hypothetical protein
MWRLEVSASLFVAREVDDKITSPRVAWKEDWAIDGPATSDLWDSILWDHCRLGEDLHLLFYDTLRLRGHQEELLSDDAAAESILGRRREGSGTTLSGR